MATVLFPTRVACGGRSPKQMFTAHLRVRGGNPREEIVATCSGLEHAIRCAKRTFKDFDDRNPWAFHDSLRGTLYILVDAELKGRRTKSNGVN